MESISPVNSYMNPWKTIKASALSYLTGKPTNSMIRPSAILEPNFFLWLKHFLMNSSREQILYHSEGMRQMGAAITPLMEELFQVTGFVNCRWTGMKITLWFFIVKINLNRLDLLLQGVLITKMETDFLADIFF